MKWISIGLLLLSTLMVSCDTINECKHKAMKLGLDTELCVTDKNRLLIRQKFIGYSRAIIKGKPPVDCSVSVLTNKISELETELVICEGTDKGCDKPVPVKCDCLDPTEKWNQ